MPPSEAPQPFDLENFQAEFTQALENPQNALQKLVEALQQNPDFINEILQATKAALKAAAVQQSPAATEMRDKTEIAMEDKLRAALKEILHHILGAIKKDSFGRDINQLGHKSSWASLNSWIVVEDCENGFGPLRCGDYGLMTKLLIKEGADDTYGPYCGMQVAVEKSDSKLHALIIIKLIRVGEENIVEISSHSVDGFATVTGPKKDTIENHGGDYRVCSIKDINPEEWDVVDGKSL